MRRFYPVLWTLLLVISSNSAVQARSEPPTTAGQTIALSLNTDHEEKISRASISGTWGVDKFTVKVKTGFIYRLTITPELVDVKTIKGDLGFSFYTPQPFNYEAANGSGVPSVDYTWIEHWSQEVTLSVRATNNSYDLTFDPGKYTIRIEEVGPSGDKHKSLDYLATVVTPPTKITASLQDTFDLDYFTYDVEINKHYKMTMDWSGTGPAAFYMKKYSNKSTGMGQEVQPGSKAVIYFIADKDDGRQVFYVGGHHKAEGDYTVTIEVLEDSDGDGYPDAMELNDPRLRSPPATYKTKGATGADPNKKDIFIELDYIGPKTFNFLFWKVPHHGHKPGGYLLQAMIDRFEERGWNVFIVVDDEIPHVENGLDREFLDGKEEGYIFDNYRDYPLYLHGLFADKSPVAGRGLGGLFRLNGHAGGMEFTTFQGNWYHKIEQLAGITTMHEVGHIVLGSYYSNPKMAHLKDKPKVFDDGVHCPYGCVMNYFQNFITEFMVVDGLRQAVRFNYGHRCGKAIMGVPVYRDGLGLTVAQIIKAGGTVNSSPAPFGNAIDSAPPSFDPTKPRVPFSNEPERYRIP